MFRSFQTKLTKKIALSSTFTKLQIQSNKRFYTQLTTNPHLYLHDISEIESDQNTKILSLSPLRNSIPIGLININIENDKAKEDLALTPNSFVPKTSLPNTTKLFLDILHNVLLNNIHNDSIFSSLAINFKTQFMPIYDLRNPPNYGRIPEIDDIFGYVWIDKDGNIVKDTYAKNDNYRLVNSNGGINLTDDMNKLVKEECERLDSE